MPRLPLGFFERSAPDVAPDLLGRTLARRLPDGAVLRVRIVETEAYESDDPASHSFRGPTRRNATMFGGPGRLYVYLAYGMHWCMNVVTGPKGHGSAVLFRAGEPLEGIGAMATLRGTDQARLLCAGPGRWAQAFAVTATEDGADLVRGRTLWLEPGAPVPSARVVAGPRVGIRRGIDLPWRYFEEGSPWVSTSRGRAPSPPSR